jgi:UDP-N-acetylglucosamine 2-epimerase (non-hydrolysing)
MSAKNTAMDNIVTPISDSSKTLLLIAGTRPEIIKTAPVVIEARKRNEFRVVYCLTGQHKTMAAEALSIFGIKADRDLEIMRPNQTLNHIAKSVFAKVPSVIEQVKPDVVMVQGDTTTAAMVALCSFNMKVPVAHIEAGLRSFNLAAPYPEECNRRIISVFSSYNLCPTESARKNLQREGAAEKTLFVTGNTVVDALRLIQEKQNLDGLERVFPNIQKPFILITAHRRESFGAGFESICKAIQTLARKYPRFQFIYPVHLNPNVQKPVHRMLSDLSNVKLVEPVPYLELLTLLKHCEFVLTDSGGIQEESPSFGKHCIVLREATERMESVDLGTSELVGTDLDKILGAVQRIAEGNVKHSVGENPYGDGHASERILDILQKAEP